MFGLSPATRVFVAVDPIDVRKGFNGLFGLVLDTLSIRFFVTAPAAVYEYISINCPAPLPWHPVAVAANRPAAFCVNEPANGCEP